MTDALFSDGGEHIDFTRLVHIGGGVDLGTLHRQHFYAVRASGSGFSLPFSVRPFTVMVDMTGSADDAVLRKYAAILTRHGCVQAICRGEESHRMHRIFEDLSETGELDRNGSAFTSMCMEDEPREDVLRYFSLPCGLAKTKLILIIGGQDDYQAALNDFLNVSGLAGEILDEEESLRAAAIEVGG
ncbi:MAG: hypothetical protein LBV15_02640 [Planctomycetota bacterium]|nr:hypothetical protein [Planctomycetota bacterium]